MNSYNTVKIDEQQGKRTSCIYYQDIDKLEFLRASLVTGKLLLGLDALVSGIGLLSSQRLMRMQLSYTIITFLMCAI